MPKRHSAVSLALMGEPNVHRIAIATCDPLPEPDPDQAPLIRALEQRGAKASLVPWRDSDTSLADFDVCVLRSTWDYYRHIDEFRRWVARASAECRLLNRPDVVLWNLDKHYLRDLSGQGLPIVPTHWIERGEDAAERFGVWRGDHPGSGAVIKPTISAASFLTRSFTAEDDRAAIAYLAEHLPERAMMIQPWLRSVARRGEKSIAWIDGQITHAWRKWPRFAGEPERAEGDTEIDEEARRIVDASLAGRDVLYARIDLLVADDGRPLLSELELIEPSLYFDFCPRALRRFVDGVLRRCV